MDRLEAIWRNICPDCMESSWKRSYPRYGEETISLISCQTCNYVTEHTAPVISENRRLRDAARGYRESNQPRKAEASPWMQSLYTQNPTSTAYGVGQTLD